MSEIFLKLQRVRQFLAKRKFSAALLGNQNNFSWITGGKNAHVVLASEAAIAGILVTSRHAHVLTNATEHPRLYAEEITPAQFQPLVHPWYEADSAKKLIKKVVGKGIVVSDNGAYGTRNMGGILARLRWQLLPEEIKRYREVGAAAIRAEPLVIPAESGLARRVAKRLFWKIRHLPGIHPSPEPKARIPFW